MWHSEFNRVAVLTYQLSKSRTLILNTAGLQRRASTLTVFKESSGILIMEYRKISISEATCSFCVIAGQAELLMKCESCLSDSILSIFVSFIIFYTLLYFTSSVIEN